MDQSFGPIIEWLIFLLDGNLNKLVALTSGLIDEWKNRRLERLVGCSGWIVRRMDELMEGWKNG